MALQTIPGGLWIPQRTSLDVPFLANMVIDAADEKIAFIFKIGKTGTISKVGFKTGSVTTGATFDVRLETVDLTTGDPTGTLLATNSNGSLVVADADDFLWLTASLTTAVAVTRGDLVAVVIVNPSGSPGNMQIMAVAYGQNRFPYSDLFTTSWTKQGDNRNPNCALEYDDGTYALHTGVYPIKLTPTDTYNSASSPDERGLIFQFPFPVQIAGVFMIMDLDGDADIVLYDSDGSTVLETISLDKDVRELTTIGGWNFPFDNTNELSANTNYRVALKPTTTTNIGLATLETDTAAIMDSFEGGQNFHYTSRTDAGAWTETTTKRPVIGLLLDGFDDSIASRDIITLPVTGGRAS